MFTVLCKSVLTLFEPWCFISCLSSQVDIDTKQLHITDPTKVNSGCQMSNEKGPQVVDRGDEISYPALWGFKKTHILCGSLLTNQDFMESIRVCFAWLRCLQKCFCFELVKSDSLDSDICCENV